MLIIQSITVKLRLPALQKINDKGSNRTSAAQNTKVGIGPIAAYGATSEGNFAP